MADFIIALVYLFAGLFAWHAVLRPDGVNSVSANLPGWLFLLAIVLHAMALGNALFAGEGINIGFSHAVSLIVWLTVVSYLVPGRDARMTRLAHRYLAPFAVVAALLPTLLPAQHVVMYGGWAFRLHFVVAILAYALFTVAALHALLMIFLEKRLHAADADAINPELPPLLQVEAMLFQLLWMAFTLLTITVLSGALFSEALFNQAFRLSYKTVFSLLSWAIFGALLLGHRLAGWRGRLAARWTLIGFGMLLLAYIGSKFVAEIILHRV